MYVAYFPTDLGQLHEMVTFQHALSLIPPFSHRLYKIYNNSCFSSNEIRLLFFSNLSL